jgi:hypothetical protein
MRRPVRGSRVWLFLLLVACASVALADEPGSSSVAVGEKVLEFARGNIGEVVGNGQCTDLVFKAFRFAEARRFRRDGPEADFIWGERLESVKDARPGDVLQFRDAVFKGQKTYRNGSKRFWEYHYPHHTAIVSDIKKTKRGLIVTVVHQNVSNGVVDPDQPRPVRRDALNLSELQQGGQVIAYRPVPESD